MQEKFADKVKEVIKEWFGENPEESPDLCRVVSDRHFDRLASLISTSTGNVVFGKVFFYYSHFKFSVRKVMAFKPAIVKPMSPTKARFY